MFSRLVALLLALSAAGAAILASCDSNGPVPPYPGQPGTVASASPGPAPIPIPAPSPQPVPVPIDAWVSVSDPDGRGFTVYSDGSFRFGSSTGADAGAAGVLSAGELADLAAAADEVAASARSMPTAVPAPDAALRVTLARDGRAVSLSPAASRAAGALARELQALEREYH